VNASTGLEVVPPGFDGETKEPDGAEGAAMDGETRSALTTGGDAAAVEVNGVTRSPFCGVSGKTAVESFVTVV
jgi:hypothetical protein